MADIRIIPSIGAINVTGSAEFKGAGGSTLLYMTGSGGIGVGTTIPQSEFHVKSTGTRFFTLERSGVNSWDLGVNSSKTFLITDNSAAADRIAITLSGSVGIGTTQPSEQLHVAGGAKFGNSSDYVRLSVENSNAKIELVDNNQTNPPTIYGNGPYMEFHNGGSQRIRLNSNGTVQFNAYGSGTNTGTAAYGLSVDSSGNIIESTLATINGSGTANYIPKWSDSDTLTNSILYETSGLIGIGHDSPSYRLHVSSSSNFQLALSSNAGQGRTIVFKESTGGSYYNFLMGVQYNVGDAFEITPSAATGSTNFSTPAFVVTSAGNIGINTTSPSYKLDVNGNAKFASDVYFYNTVLDVASNFATQRGAAFKASTGKFEIASSETALELSRFSTTGAVLSVRHSGSQVSSLNTDGGAWFSGDMTVDGILTAREFHTTFVSASIIYQSGSTLFGDSYDDTHTFYGGVEIIESNATPTLTLTRDVGGTTYTYGQLTNAGSDFYVNGLAAIFINADSNSDSTSTDRVIKFGNRGSELMTLDATGNLGIGQTAPSTTLHIGNGSSSKNILVQSNGGGGTLRFYDSANDSSGDRYQYIGHLDTTQRLQFSATGSGAVAMSITPAGFVGIGTTNPASKLVVSDGGATGLEFSPIGGTGNDGYIQSYNRSTSAYENLTYYANDHYFNYGGTTNVIIQAGGKVGIGTTAPGFNLDVRTGAQGDIASFRGTAYPVTFASTGSAGNYYGTQMMMAADAGSTQAAFRLNSRYNSATGTGVAFTIESSTSDQSYGQNPSALTYSEKFRITQDGNVGIGTNNPGTKLHVVGDARINGTIYSGDGSISTNNSLQLIYSAGSGVGTISAKSTGGSTTLALQTANSGTTADRLYIASNGTIKLTAYGSGTKTGTAAYNLSVDSSGNIIETANPSLTGTGTANYVTKWSGTNSLTDSIIYDNGTNVGIGNATPTFTLDVNGTARFSQEAYIAGVWSTNYGPRNSGDPIKFVNWSGTEIARISTTDGNVGIGSTAPEGKLNVVGGADVLIVEGSGSTSNTTIMAVDGNNGRLFEVSDDLSDSLFSVNTIAGLPVMEAFADNRVVLGAYNQNDLYITGSKVGIGTSSPEGKLHILGNFDANNPKQLIIASREDAGSVYSGIQFERAGGGTFFGLGNDSRTDRDEILLGGGFGSVVNATAFRVFTGTRGSTIGTERLTVISDGNVGIGTSAPSYPLHVKSTESALIQIEGTTAANYTAIRYLGTGRTWSQGVGNGSETALGIANKFYLYDSSASAVRFVVNTSGNLGIGTVNPGYILDTVGSPVRHTRSGKSIIINPNYGAADTNADLQTDSGMDLTLSPAGTERVRVTTSGSVGIGITAPTARLHVTQGFTSTNLAFAAGTTGYAIANRQYDTAVIQQDDVTTLRLVERIDGSDNDQVMTLTIGDNYGRIATSKQPLQFFVSGSSTSSGYQGLSGNLAMHMALDGNIGVGTSSPGYKLEVNGSIRANSGTVYYGLSGYSYISYSGTDGYYRANGKHYFEGTSGFKGVWDANGNLGIGTTNPNQKLVVAGNMAVSASNTEGSIWFGDGQSIGLYRNNNYDLVLSQEASSGNPLYLAGAGDVIVSIDNNNNETTRKFIVGSNAVKASNELFSVNESGNVYISNDLTVDGIITAKEFHTTFVSASIIYESGSTKFGDSADDIHHFTGKVGIGLTNPAGPLTVEGGVRSKYVMLGATATDSADNTIEFVNGTNSNSYIAGHINYHGSGNLTLTYGGGNVGIGTNNPDAKLRVQKSEASSNWLTSFHNTATNGHRMYFGYGNAAGTRYGLYIEGGPGNTNLDFAVANKFYVLGTGNVGIGIDSPGVKLHVSGGYARMENGGTDAYYYEGHRTGVGTTLRLYDNANNIYIDGWQSVNLRANQNGGSGGGIGLYGGPTTIGTIDAASSDLDKFLVSDSGVVKYRTGQQAAQDMDVFTQTYALPDTSGTAQWIKVGTWSAAQGGVVATIHIAQHQGYNAATTQNQEVFIYIKTSNGSSVDGNGFAGDSSFWTQGLSSAIGTGDVLWEANAAGVSATTYTLYINAGTYTYNSQYTVTTKAGSWTNVGTLASPASTSASSTVLLSEERFVANNVLTVDSLNVGIGTTNPSDKLEVAGNINIGSSYKLYNGSASDSAGISFPSNVTRIDGYSGITFNSSTTNVGLQTERMRITNDGKVGIGTTAPAYKLDITDFGAANGTASRGMHFVNLTAGATSNFMYIGASAGTDWQLGKNVLGTASRVNFDITDHANNIAFTIDASRNVGIGLTNPGYKLEVAGNAQFTGAGAAGYGTINLVSTDSFIRLNTTGGTTDKQKWDIRAISATGYEGLEFRTINDANNSFSTKMTIAHGGNVGIGTGSPSNKLEVSGGVTATSFTGSLLGNVYTNSIYKQTTGSPIVINAGSDASLALRVYYDMQVYNGISFTNGSWTTQSYIYGDSGVMYYGANTGHQFDGKWIAPTGNSAFYISGSGGGYATFYVDGGSAQIGFGRQSSAQGLSYLGSDATYLFRLWDSSFASTYFNVQRADGNVGIGVTSPSYKLHVDGNAYFSGAVTTNSNLTVNGRYFINGNTTFGYKIAYNGLNNPSGTATDADAADGYAIYRASTHSSTMFYGPYTSISNGEYVASFRMKVADNSSTSVLGQIDVIGTNVTGSAINITPSMFETSGRYQYIDIPFTANGSNSNLEVRGIGFNAGITDTSLDHIIIRPLAKSYTQLQPENKNYDIFYHGQGVPRLRINTSGNVGIGLTNPSAKLEVNGNVFFPSTNGLYMGGTAGSLNSWGSRQVTNSGVHTLSAAGFNVDNYGYATPVTSSLYVNTTSARVGIKNSSPSYQFDIGPAGSDVVSARLTPGYERVRYNTFDLLGYDDGHLWMIGNNNPSIVLGASWDWDRQVEFAYFPGTTGAAGGILEIGQTNKNNTNYTHGITTFVTNGVEAMRINSSGNVGISSQSPGQKLDVNGNATVSGWLYAGNYLQSPTLYLSGNILTLNKAGNGWLTWAERDTAGSETRMNLDYIGTINISNTTDQKITLTATDDSWNYMGFGWSTGGRRHYVGNDSAGRFVFGADNAAYYYYFSGTKVGIDTAAPSELLELERTGKIGFGANGDYGTRIGYFDDSGGVHGFHVDTKHAGTWTTRRFVVRADSGNVGIGTYSPGKLLELYASAPALTFTPSTYGGAYQTTLGTWSGAQGHLIFGNNGSNFIQAGTSGAGGALSFYTNSTNAIGTTPNGNLAMHLNADGNVGVGLSNPTYKFQVSGTGYFNSDLTVNGNINLVANDSYLYINRSGNTRDGVLVFKTASSNKWLFGAWGNTNENFYLYSYGVGGAVAVVDYATGNVGIGSTAPDAKLNVVGGADVLIVEGSGSTANTTIMAVDGNNGRLFEVSDDLSDSLFSVNTIAGLPVMEAFADNTVVLGAYNQCDLVITGSKVGIGTCTPSDKLHIYGGSFRTDLDATYHMGMLNEYVSTYVTRTKFGRPDTSSNLELYYDIAGSEEARITRNYTSAVLKFDRGASTDMIINGSGNVGISSNAPAYKLDVNGTIRATGDVIAYSDQRVKENVVTLENSLELVKSLRGVSYNKIGEPEKKVGVIAQEILEVLPEVVQQDSEGMYSVAYGNITAVLIEAIKEQQLQIEELREEIKKLKG